MMLLSTALGKRAALIGFLVGIVASISLLLLDAAIPVPAWVWLVFYPGLHAGWGSAVIGEGVWNLHLPTLLYVAIGCAAQGAACATVALARQALRDFICSARQAHLPQV